MPMLARTSSWSPFACLVLAVSLAGCSSVPLFRSWFRKPYLPYIESSEFSCDYPWRWGRVKKIPGGAEFREPDGAAVFGIVYHPKGSSRYIEPEAYRRQMHEWGSVEDTRVVYDVTISSRPAYKVQFTTYEYNPERLLGEQAKIHFTEIIMAPDPKGIYLIRYQTAKNDFWRRRLRQPYEHFLSSLVLVPHEEKKTLFRP